MVTSSPVQNSANSAPPKAQGPVIPQNMIAIPRGAFVMGANSGDKVDDAEKPAHQVAVEAFYIGKYEVSCKEYQQFVIKTKHPAPLGWTGTSFPPGEDNIPVRNVSWDDAAAYCRWLSQETGFTIRLASEEEWEYAAKGAKDERIYPWGNEFIV